MITEVPGMPQRAKTEIGVRIEFDSTDFAQAKARMAAEAISDAALRSMAMNEALRLHDTEPNPWNDRPLAQGGITGDDVPLTHI